jgi:hypothetical protein
MPYIKTGKRPHLDDALRPLIAWLEAAPLREVDGEVNYVITRILHSAAYPTTYADFNRALGVLEAVKLELYRRRIAPYEDTKISENGDVP